MVVSAEDSEKLARKDYPGISDMPSYMKRKVGVLGTSTVVRMVEEIRSYNFAEYCNFTYLLFSLLGVALGKGG